jgi:hypothetical protein
MPGTATYRHRSTLERSILIHWEQSQVPRLRLLKSLLRPISCFLDERDRTQNVFPAVKQLSNLSTEITIGNWLPSFCQETRIPQIGRC